MAAALNTVAKGLRDELKSLSESIRTLADQAAKFNATGLDKGLKKAGDAAKPASDGLKKVGDVLGQVRAIGSSTIDGLGKSLRSLAGGDIKGAIDGVVEGLAGMAQGLDLLVPGLGQAAAAFIKFGGTAAGILYELGEKLIQENSHIRALTNEFNALGSGSGHTGAQMLAQFNELSKTLPQTREQLARMAAPLIEAGFEGDKLTRTLRAQSAATAMIGERGGAAYVSLAERAQKAARTFQWVAVSEDEVRKTGLSIKDLSEAMGISQQQLTMQLRYGSIEAKSFGNALDNALQKKGKGATSGLLGDTFVQIAKMQETISQLFQFSEGESRVGLDKFGKSLGEFATIFDKSTASGKMLHGTLHTIFEVILKKASTVLTSARRGFKMLELVWMTLVIAADPLFLSISKLNKSLATSGRHGLTFKSVLSGIGSAAAFAATSMAALVDATTAVINVSNKINSGPKGSGQSALTHQTMSSAIGALNPVLGAIHLLGHAQGGVVTGVSNGLATVKAAPGEGIASIGKGERIMPASEAKDKGGGMSVGGVTITINGGKGSSMVELTEEAIALMFERIAMKQGFAR